MNPKPPSQAKRCIPCSTAIHKYTTAFPRHFPASFSYVLLFLVLDRTCQLKTSMTNYLHIPSLLKSNLNIKALAFSESLTPIFLLIVVISLVYAYPSSHSCPDGMIIQANPSYPR